MLAGGHYIRRVSIAGPDLESALIFDLHVCTNPHDIALPSIQSGAIPKQVLNNLPRRLVRPKIVEFGLVASPELSLIAGQPPGSSRARSQQRQNQLRSMPDPIHPPVWSRPQIGKIRAADGQADAVPGGKAPPRGVQLDLQFVDFPRLQRRGLAQGIAPCSI